MILIGWLLSALYISLIGTFLLVWVKMKLYVPKTSHSGFSNFSIIIPVRNEGKNIQRLLNDIAEQDYPNSKYEVIVVNDHSTDDTEEKVKDFIKEKNNFSLIHLKADQRIISYKKFAIEKGINASANETIITIDGDCRVGKHWLGAINKLMIEKEPVCICGPVSYLDDGKPFTRLQVIEFSALLGSGASTIGLGFPGMCNGANLIYQKAAFHAVGGFDGIDHVASGDDELLMHKILAKYPKKVFFLKNQEAIVYTESNQTLRQFYNQRKRWASKWASYKSWFVKVLALLIFIVNLYFAIGPLLVLLNLVSLQAFLFQLVLKLLIEGLFISRILIFLKNKIDLFYLIPLQIVYPFYTIFFGIVANFGGYDWKDRKIDRK